MRFPRPRLSELRCMKEPYIRNMFIKNAAAFLLSIFVGVVAVIAAKTGTALLPVLFMALYFLVTATCRKSSARQSLLSFRRKCKGTPQTHLCWTKRTEHFSPH